MPSIEVEDTFPLPKAKRQRIETFHSDTHVAGSRIFSPFRTLGLVSTTSVPFTSVPLGKTTFQITTSIGRTLQTYDLRRGLDLVFLSRPRTPDEITATCTWKDRVYAAWGTASSTSKGIWIYKRGKKIAELEAPLTSRSPIEKIVVFGSWVVGCTRERVEVWKSNTNEHYTRLAPSGARARKGDRILSGEMCSMPTFLNKIFLGRHDGGVEIWNLSTGKLIYTIWPATNDDSAVTALEPAPALSMLAIAYANGTIVIHNVRADKEVLRLQQSSSPRGPISSISFRTDGLGAGSDSQQDGLIATAGMDSGDVTFWDLNEGGRVKGVLRGAHETVGPDRVCGITRVEFLPAQPVLVSSGVDNSLKSWVFDETSSSSIPRPLHSRSGHSAGITRLAFLPTNSDGSDAMGKWLLSASRDRSLWGFSLRKDGQSIELSQGHVKKNTKKMRLASAMGGGASVFEDLKAPEITCIACSLNRDGGMGAVAGGQAWTNAKFSSAEESHFTGWESVVTGHKGDKFARTWFWGKKKAGRWAFESGDGMEVRSVAVTACGTFALVGSAGGNLDMFNLQSGIHRQRFPPTRSPAEMKRLRTQIPEKALMQPEKAHGKAVTGIAVDSLNKTVLSCGLDGIVKFWDFSTGVLQDEVPLIPVTAITALRSNPSTDLIALACDDSALRILDMETKKIVRELWGCAGQIYDYSFSPDGRWIVASSTSSGVQVWDLPTGHLIDSFRTNQACTSLAFSTTGEFLATAHADEVGIRLWNNRSLFVHIPTTNLDEANSFDVDDVEQEGTLAIDAAYEDEELEADASVVGSSMEQLSRDVLTLSLVPKSRWQTLVHLDAIRQRNKPIEPPRAPTRAPFFLSASLADGSQGDSDKNHDLSATPAERSRIMRMERNGVESRFTTLLRLGLQEGNYDSFIDHSKNLSPSAMDVEIRSLSASELIPFVAALTDRLRQRKDYDLVNAWMAVFLRVQSDAVSEHERVLTMLAKWRHEQEREGQRLANLAGYCSGILSFLRSSRA